MAAATGSQLSVRLRSYGARQCRRSRRSRSRPGGRHSLTRRRSFPESVAPQGTLLAAHAIVASFLGATTVKAHQGLHVLGWLAVAALVLGLVEAACILSPWRK